MRAALLDQLRCPACGDPLTGEPAGPLASACGRTFPVPDGIPALLYPDELAPSDAEFKDKYDSGADVYARGLDWLFASFGEDAQRVRTRMSSLLELEPGARVLETGCGTGEDSSLILDRIGSEGSLVAQDISAAMLGLAREKLDSAGTVDWLQSNASHLPLPDASFDAAFHFGGINEFGEIKRAIAEMARVVRPGGKVVVGDEGVAPWLRRKRFGQILINANPLYKHRPPMDKLPVEAREVRVQWLLGNSFYVIDFRVGEGEPFLDIDLPIPGRGDSLRSRWEASRGG